MTTTVATLEAHTDEVWDIQWSHGGTFLASASKDKSVIIWRQATSTGGGTLTRDWSVHHILRGHIYPVGRLAWSPDDQVLLTSSLHLIKIWDAKTGRCIRTLEEHEDSVTSICWLPDGAGFITGALDRKIIVWNTDGQVRDVLDRASIRITDLAITPNTTRFVAIGIEYIYPSEIEPVRTLSDTWRSLKYQLVVYNLATKEIESSTRLEADLTSVQISPDSKFALINQAPSEIHLWDINEKRIRHSYKGQKQGHHVIRSCFGGVDSTLIISGSEDGNVYIWNRHIEAPIEVLSGHGDGSVNTVAWNPVNNPLLASCSDDHTIRIWEVPSLGVKQKVDPQVV